MPIECARVRLSTANRFALRVSFRLFRVSTYRIPKEKEREKENRSPSNGRTPLLDKSGSLGSQQTSDGQRMPKINVRRTTKRNTRARKRETRGKKEEESCGIFLIIYYYEFPTV